MCINTIPVTITLMNGSMERFYRECKKKRLIYELFFSKMYSLGLESTLIVHLITTFNIRFPCGDLVTVSVTQGGLGLIKHDDKVSL